MKGATAKEPELYSKNEANAYGVLKDRPTLADGSVRIPTVFHMVGEEEKAIRSNPAARTTDLLKMVFG